MSKTAEVLTYCGWELLFSQLLLKEKDTLYALVMCQQ